LPTISVAPGLRPASGSKGVTAGVGAWLGASDGTTLCVDEGSGVGESAGASEGDTPGATDGTTEAEGGADAVGSAAATTGSWLTIWNSRSAEVPSESARPRTSR